MSDQKNEKLSVVKGIVTEALPSTLFRVKIPARNATQSVAGGDDKNEIDTEQEILAYLSGKMRMHRIKVLIGDAVEVVLDSYGGKGRIIKRL
ncbi:hypothetical protein A2917_01580 [Candidatus Nomurabacteria bacterium RIFCSPLOWO2_01_FULL_42_17]|uniref:S1-like domain-containing protein n=1 Tax=Candidatus Nomurabacteria bacterium RIFCSPLOWO2_01_FULL_42_17 TaxID=1801780 RepID=A0A1F6XLS8_9BACT|nr:MAG: hypothetical protein A2917_01580 [Candidatus Nomurabacteria bacterium RIFCSPLOWO2_01_FULL_42_17]